MIRVPEPAIGPIRSIFPRIVAPSSGNSNHCSVAVAGVSIGAINATVLCGSRKDDPRVGLIELCLREDRLREHVVERLAEAHEPEVVAVVEDHADHSSWGEVVAMHVPLVPPFDRRSGWVLARATRRVRRARLRRRMPWRCPGV